MVTPHGRSGSYLIHGLLDGHPQILCFPDSLKYIFPKIISDIHTELEKFISSNPYCFRSRDRSKADTCLLGKNKDEHYEVDKILFRKFFNTEANLRISSNGTLSRKNFIIILHIALAKTINKKLQKVKYLLIHLHSYHGGHDSVLHDFPDSLFLACLRDPRENFLSCMRVLEIKAIRGNAGLINYHKNHVILDSHLCLTKLIRFLAKIPKEQALLIDLNTFHSLGERGIRKLAHFLKINFSTSMHTTTLLGKIWWGNSALKEVSTGVNIKRAVPEWSKNLPNEDQILISTFLEQHITSLGYEKGTTSKTLKFKDPRASVAGLKIQLQDVFGRRRAKFLTTLTKSSRVIGIWLIRNLFHIMMAVIGVKSLSIKLKKDLVKLEKDRFLS